MTRIEMRSRIKELDTEIKKLIRDFGLETDKERAKDLAKEIREKGEELGSARRAYFGLSMTEFKEFIKKKKERS